MDVAIRAEGVCLGCNGGSKSSAVEVGGGGLAVGHETFGGCVCDWMVFERRVSEVWSVWQMLLSRSTSTWGLEGAGGGTTPGEPSGVVVECGTQLGRIV